MDLDIRPAREDDIPALTDIFNYYIENGYSTYKEKPVTIDFMLGQFEQYDLIGPYRMIVAEFEGRIVGRAGSCRYREPVVFDKTIEVGISVVPDITAQGVGSSLYQALFDVLIKEDLHLAVAGIALPNDGSVALHKKFGFKDVGVFDEYALVKGRFRSSVWMQKRLDI
ncbi:GNAT family N-acetyltransferase [Porticoccaceae bacterium]|nr:GNAT family N-acetyltransferase [Porticoccaceae bacterium]